MASVPHHQRVGVRRRKLRVVGTVHPLLHVCDPRLHQRLPGKKSEGERDSAIYTTMMLAAVLEWRTVCAKLALNQAHTYGQPLCVFLLVSGSSECPALTERCQHCCCSFEFEVCSFLRPHRTRIVRINR